MDELGRRGRGRATIRPSLPSFERCSGNPTSCGPTGPPGLGRPYLWADRLGSEGSGSLSAAPGGPCIPPADSGPRNRAWTWAGSFVPGVEVACEGGRRPETRRIAVAVVRCFRSNSFRPTSYPRTSSPWTWCLGSDDSADLGGACGSA